MRFFTSPLVSLLLFPAPPFYQNGLMPYQSAYQRFGVFTKVL
jgi:hypothetical protein